VAALFTSVPLYETLQTLSQKFHREAADLIKHVLTNTYFFMADRFSDRRTEWP
jgi:hypothetical protein